MARETGEWRKRPNCLSRVFRIGVVDIANFANLISLNAVVTAWDCVGEVWTDESFEEHSACGKGDRAEVISAIKTTLEAAGILVQRLS